MRRTVYTGCTNATEDRRQRDCATEKCVAIGRIACAARAVPLNNKQSKPRYNNRMLNDVAQCFD